MKPLLLIPAGILAAHVLWLALYGLFLAVVVK